MQTHTCATAWPVSLTLVHALVCSWMSQGALVLVFALETCLWDLLRDVGKKRLLR